MVSYLQVEGYGIEQGFKGIAKSSSARKKPTLAKEDEFFMYDQTRSGDVTSRPKTALEHYDWWYRNNVKFEGGVRITPLTEFEERLGVASHVQTFRLSGWCAGVHRDGYQTGCVPTQTFTNDEWTIFRQTNDITGAQVRIISTSDTPTDLGQGAKDWARYFAEKATEQNLEVIDIQNLEFREKQKPAVVEKTRPNPKEVEKVEPVEVEPIEEVVKYSPLMIAGVIAVIVIILWRRV